MYKDGSKELLQGCSKCGAKFFFFIRQAKLEEGKKVRKKIKKKDLAKMERDVRSLMPDIKRDEPVVLDFETIRVVGPGKYEIDVGSLMRGNPIIIQVGDGKYYIDLFTAMNKKKKKE
jgi:predicted  nucleic acid-binding Zn-ribbon protein